MPHIRPRLWRSVRMRLLLPVLLASVGVMVLGAAQLDSAITEADMAGRSGELARAAQAVSQVAHHVSLEYIRQNEERRGVIEMEELERQIAETDTAIAEFRRANVAIRAAAPALTELSEAADRALDAIESSRAVARQSPEGTTEVRAFYDQMVRAALVLGEALATEMSDRHLIELARGLTLVGELHHIAVQQYDLVARGLHRQDFEPAAPFVLAELVGTEREQIDALQSLAVPGARYRDLVNEDLIAAAASIRQVILDGRGTPASMAIDPEAWSEAQTARMDGLWEMERQLAVDLNIAADDLGAAARDQAYLIGLLTVGVVGGTLAVAITIAFRLSRRLRQTRRAALMAAGFELPGAVANVIAARDEESVRTVLAESSGRVDSLLRPEPDEIGEVATAFGAVHRQALRLAADQALLRMEVQSMFVALSRRGQTLVQRQIHLIDEFSRNEADPDALERLFALDHLAARMRRNEENLLVLAGGEPGRWITRPVAMVDLVRAAAQEIEEYRRVEVEDVPSVAISAQVAGDAIHLLAELLENATSFSPPETRVRVRAGRTVDGLAVYVMDGGIGMPDARLVEANERLSAPSTLTSALVGTMGLLVVARLAQRHGIHVRLESAPAAGTTATVTFPDRLVVPLSMVEQLQPGQWARELGSHNGRPPAAAAVTSLPMSLPTGSATAHHTGTVAAQHPYLGQPGAGRQPGAGHGHSHLGQPAPALPTQRGPSSLEARTDETMVLPRRTQDEPLTHDSMPRPGPGSSALTPDPEAVRARLSSLAHGIAAAQQGHAAPPPPPTPPSR